MALKSEFFNDLEGYFATSGEARTAFEKSILDKYESVQVVFTLDISGFSLLVREKGILYYLAMIRQMQTIVQPVIRSCNGRLIKFEADNCFATFKSVEDSLDAALRIAQAFSEYNSLPTTEEEIHISIGIAQGTLIVFDDEDFFGNAVNISSKLGEDIAEKGQILIEKESFDSIDKSQFQFREKNYSISGLQLGAYEILSRLKC